MPTGDAAEVTAEQKQLQFNAAMELFNTRSIYRAIGYAVATVNILLQIFLVSRVMPLSLGVTGQLLALAAAWLLTDFINGLVHMYMDCNDRYSSLAGPLIANFHLHHQTPLYRKNPLPIVYFLESGAKIWLVGYLLAVALLLAAMPVTPLAAYILVYIGILSSVAEVSHYLCHSSTSALARLLASCGLLLSKRHHGRHHLEDNRNYAFLNGWSDPLLNLIARRCSPGYKSTTDTHYAGYDSGAADSR
jgi:sterol desaturase/sphingolipid hydroxylase (fatty acid hydroxylase superfamily)